MKNRFKVVIVGAGVVGLTLAARLARGPSAEAVDVTLLDAAARPEVPPDDDIALRVSAISEGSVGVLDAAGAWPLLDRRRLSPYECMQVWDENDTPHGRASLRFEAAEFALPELGFIVENSRLQDALLRALEGTDVRLRFRAPIRSLGRSGERHVVELDGKDSLEADLLVGADGSRSFVRSAAGIGTRTFRYGQSAFVTHLCPERPHQATAWQRFLRDGPLGILPLADGRVSVVWSTTPERAAEAHSASDADLATMLTEASGRVLGKLAPAGARGQFPLAAQHAERYVLPGIALIGDAAHTIHPLAGQGANLGLQDAAQLADVLEAAVTAGRSPGDRPTLRRYERARKGANATMLHFMTGLNRLFATDSRLLARLRTAGMQVFNRSGPIREHAVRVALGIR